MLARHLIVLEGVDGAGTTTHARLLGRNLRDRKMPVHVTAEPSQGPVGGLLRQTLSGRMVTGGIAGGRAPSWNTMALMFAADRLDHMETEITPNLREGVTVVCDRYYHSSVVYQSVTGGAGHEAIGWIRDINRFAARPALTIVLDVTPEEASNRRRHRRGADIFDDEDLQREINGLYRDLDRHFPGENIVHVDAMASVEEVAARILVPVESLIARH